MSPATASKSDRDRAGEPRSIILASRSPQRRRLIEQLGVPVEILTPDYDEVPLGIGPEETVLERARGKANSVAAHHPGAVVIGVDTEVVDGEGDVLGQPADSIAATRMLRRLAGREHRVLSGIAVLGRGIGTDVVESRVRFRTLTDAEIDDYVARGEWRGRAGGYAIQEDGGGLVAEVMGPLDNVIGLPLDALRRLLDAEGIAVPEPGGNAAPT
jgi:septum formation protein